VVLARSAETGDGEMVGKMKKKNLKSGDFRFWRAARQQRLFAQRAS
jgi:hypothetical protein